MTSRPGELARLRDVAPGVLIDLRYATAANVTGRRLYRSREAWLRRSTALKVKAAQEWFSAKGLVLKILDAYRPPSAQRALWDAIRDPRFAAPPWRGSRHTRGAAIDATLATEAGVELEMPSAHDECGERASRTWSGVGEPARTHSLWLLEGMEAAGFVGLEAEWWHFDDSDWRDFPLLDWEPDAGEDAGALLPEKRGAAS